MGLVRELDRAVIDEVQRAPRVILAVKRSSPRKLKAERVPFGALLETFVLAELLKLASWNDAHFEFFHFRDRDRNEVDIVIENGEGQVVGIEVKAAATAGGEDFSGLRKLAEVCGKRFTLGLVLCDHDTVVPFGERMFAASVSCLWG